MGSLKISQYQLFNLQQKLDLIKWHKNIFISPNDNIEKTQTQNLNFWIKYTESMTKALATSHFTINLLFNKKIKNIWHRHVLIYVNNKPYIYAITKTASPLQFNLLSLGKKSIGSQLFTKNIIKHNFEFSNNQTLVDFINRNLNLNVQKLYARQRKFTYLKHILLLQEYFIIN